MMYMLTFQKIKKVKENKKKKQNQGTNKTIRKRISSVN